MAYADMLHKCTRQELYYCNKLTPEWYITDYRLIAVLNLKRWVCDYEDLSTGIPPRNIGDDNLSTGSSPKVFFFYLSQA